MKMLNGLLILAIFNTIVATFFFCLAVNIGKDRFTPDKPIYPQRADFRNVFFVLSCAGALVACLSFGVCRHGFQLIEDYDTFANSIYIEKSKENNLYYGDLGEEKKHLKSNETINNDQKIKIILYERDNLFMDVDADNHFGEIEVVGSD